MTLPAVMYARVSSREQAEGYSLDAQTKLLHTYAASHGFTVSTEHQFLEVESAGRTGREKFSEMVRFLKRSRTVRDVLVEKTDRLLRNLEDWVIVDDLDVRIHLVKEGEVISRESSSHQKLIHGIKVLLAKNYIDNLSEEVRKGMTEAISQGDWPHDVPVGYTRDRDGEIVLEPEKAAIVKELFVRIGRGESIRAVVFWAKTIGFTATKRGRLPMGKSQVERIVKNVFYTGQMRWKQQLFSGNHPAIMTVKQWDRANEALRSPVHGSVLYPPKENLAFWGLLTCAKCGCSVVGETKKAGRYVYYRCTHGRGDCDEGYVRAEALDAQFRELVARVRVDDEIGERVKQGLRESLDDETAYHLEEVAKLNAQLVQIKRWKNKVYEDRLEGRLAEDFWLQKMNEFQMEESRINSNIAAHQAADNRYYEQGCVTLELAQRAETMWDSLSAPRKRQLLQILLSNSTLAGGVITATYRQPFDLLAELAAVRAQKKPGSDLSEPGSYMWRG